MMKENNFKKEAEKSTRELFKFPHKISVSHNDLKLFDIEIDIKPNEKALSTSKNRGLLVTAISELMNSYEFLKKEIELRVRIHEKELHQKFYISGLCPLLMLYSDQFQFLDYANYFYCKDEDIFNRIRAEGPISLRSSHTQRKLNEWISDENISASKINTLRDSLMEYALGPSFKDKLLKQGRPELDLIRIFGTKLIKEIYSDIKSILNIAKKKQKYDFTYEFGDLIEQSFKDFLFDLKRKYEKSPDSVDKQKKLTRILDALECYERLRLPTFLTVFLEDDKYLRSEFMSFRWEPNKLAKEFLAKLFDSSVSKIEKILYSKKKD